MDKETYRIRLDNLNYIAYRRYEQKKGERYWPYNHIVWLLTLETQRATDLKTTRD